MTEPGVDVDIVVPSAGPALVRMRYADDNRVWLRRAIGRRKPMWDADRRVWLVPRAAARRVFDRATADRRPARLTRRFAPDTVVCTTQCQTARPETVHDCTCVCGGEQHGRVAGGWSQTGRDLLVRATGGMVEQVITNRVDGQRRRRWPWRRG